MAYTYNYVTKNEAALKQATDFVNSIYNLGIPEVMYKDSYPITDLKDMMYKTVALHGRDHISFKQRYPGDKEFTSITLGQTLDDMNALGTSLMNLGLKDQRIAVIGENCYQWEVSYLAVVCGVGTVVPLDKELGENELAQLVKEADCKAVLFTNKFEGIFKSIKANQPGQPEILINLNAKENTDEVYSFQALIDAGMERLEHGDMSYLERDIDPEKMSILLFTSGTTGISKGVMLNQRNICCDLMSAPIFLKVTTEDLFFSVLPVHHTYECTCGFLMPLYKGAAVGFCEGLKHIQSNLKELQPTFILGVPLIFESLYRAIWKNIRKQGKEDTVKKVLKLNRKTSKVGLNLNKILLKDIINVFGGKMRMIISGGAAIDSEILQFFIDLGIPSVQGYGLTECAPMAALNPDKNPRNASAGHVLGGMEAKIVNPDADGNGEICLKGPNVMMGYFNMPEETAAVLKDGWFYSGDLGHITEDYIYITGRKKNVIITKNGKNVFPEELEFYLGKSNLVEESMVWADADATGQDDVIVATVKPNMDEVIAKIGAEAAKDEAKIKELIDKEVDKINEDLPLFKKIKKVVVKLDDFEKTTGKKIKRFKTNNRQ